MKTDKASFKQFRTDFAKAVAALETKHSIKLSLGNISYDDYGFRTKLEAVIGTADNQKDGELLSFKADYMRHCSSYGLTPQQWLTEVELNGRKYKIVGIAPRSRKYPIIAEKTDGKFCKIPASYVQ
jgi:hypothetical protein